jgi:hypothetical protein
MNGTAMVLRALPARPSRVSIRMGYTSGVWVKE